jgi:hypothetical protein
MTQDAPNWPVDYGCLIKAYLEKRDHILRPKAVKKSIFIGRSFAVLTRKNTPSPPITIFGTHIPMIGG